MREPTLNQWIRPNRRPSTSRPKADPGPPSPGSCSLAGTASSSASKMRAPASIWTQTSAISSLTSSQSTADLFRWTTQAESVIAWSSRVRRFPLRRPSIDALSARLDRGTLSHASEFIHLTASAAGAFSRRSLSRSLALRPFARALQSAGLPQMLVSWRPIRVAIGAPSKIGWPCAFSYTLHAE